MGKVLEKEKLATKQDLQVLESKLTTEIQKTKNELLKWLVVHRSNYLYSYKGLKRIKEKLKPR